MAVRGRGTKSPEVQRLSSERSGVHTCSTPTGTRKPPQGPGTVGAGSRLGEKGWDRHRNSDSCCAATTAARPSGTLHRARTGQASAGSSRLLPFPRSLGVTKGLALPAAIARLLPCGYRPAGAVPSAIAGLGGLARGRRVVRAPARVPPWAVPQAALVGGQRTGRRAAASSRDGDPPVGGPAQGSVGRAPSARARRGSAPVCRPWAWSGCVRWRPWPAACARAAAMRPFRR